MGLPYITPDKLTQHYATIGESGCSRCGELRTDGSGVYALFKASAEVVADADNTKVYVTLYSYPDISVAIDSTAKATIGLFQEYGSNVAAGRYVWVCLRGISKETTSHFDTSNIVVGQALRSFGAALSGTLGANLRPAISLIDVTALETVGSEVFFVRPLA